MNSGEKNARIVWRMKSVEVTRVIPSRCATSVATVDLPVPVAPPISSTIGTSSDCRSASGGAGRSPGRPPPRPSTSRASSRGGRPRSPSAALGEVELDPPRELVRALDRDAGRDQRARHQALRVRQPVVAERQRLAVPALRHASTGTSASSSSSSPGATTSLRGEHDAHAAGERVLGDDVDRGGLHLDEVRVGVDEVARAARSRSARLGETWTTSASRCETSRAPAVKTATRPSSGSRSRRAAGSQSSIDEVGDRAAGTC